MMLNNYQKSVYLIILNATMILRSIGKTFKNNNNTRTLKDFKIFLFNEINDLTELMDESRLNEEDLLNTIKNLSNQFGLSIGQSQKAINVILKYHFHLTNKYSSEIKKILHCPIDSKILKLLEINNLRLNAIDLTTYTDIQFRIGQRSNFRIDFDDNWDNQHLNDDGLL